MGRKVDLRGKLGLAGGIVIVTDFGELTVDGSAASVLQVLAAVQGRDSFTDEELADVFGLLFEEADAYERASEALNLDGLTDLMRAAMDAATGAGEREGEAATPATT